MSNEPNKPAELTEKELEGIVGGARGVFAEFERQTAAMPVQKEVWTQTEVVQTAEKAFSGRTTTTRQ